MKKQLFLIFSIVSSLSLQASKQESEPVFDSGYIKMATQGGLCGGVTLVPNPDALVRVQARRFSEGLFGSAMQPGDILSDWVELAPGGMRVRYDWAGARPSHHYRIYCQRRNQRGHWEPIACREVMAISDKKHNAPCVIGPLGPRAEFGKLKMSTTAEAKKN